MKPLPKTDGSDLLIVGGMLGGMLAAWWIDARLLLLLVAMAMVTVGLVRGR